MISDDVLAVSPATECLTQVLPWLAKTMDSIVRFKANYVDLKFKREM